LLFQIHILYRYTETLTELAADPAKALMVLRALAGDAPSAGETPAAAAGAFTVAGAALGPYVEEARGKVAARLEELKVGLYEFANPVEP
jgi:hypothetical protein